MSFSNRVKGELAREIPDRTCCQRAEMAALIHAGGRLSRIGPDWCMLLIQTEQAACARKIFSLLKAVYGIQARVKVGKRKRFKQARIYEVHAMVNQRHTLLWHELAAFNLAGTSSGRLGAALIGRTCCKRAYIRGVFLTRGFINRPEGEYHLEMVFDGIPLARQLQWLLSRFNLPAKTVERKKKQVLYIKEGDKIGDFLRVVGAHRALLDFENVRILKSMRNDINRQVNCETANLGKTVHASVRQIELINKMVGLKGWDFFPAQLRDLAQVRIEYPEQSLKELGAMLDPPLSKSGAAYRMRKLERWAQEVIDTC